MALTPTQARFVELERQREAYKEFLQELKEATQAVADECGIDSYFQDESDGTVYKIVIPRGRYVEFETVGYVRTRRGDEKQGTLSQKEAKEAGFEV